MTERGILRLCNNTQAEVDQIDAASCSRSFHEILRPRCFTPSYTLNSYTSGCLDTIFVSGFNLRLAQEHRNSRGSLGHKITVSRPRTLCTRKRRRRGLHGADILQKEGSEDLAAWDGWLGGAELAELL